MKKTQPPNNLNFIATYLFHHPGAKYTEILCALAEWTGNQYRPGLYSTYLSNSWQGGGRYKGVYWNKMSGSVRSGYLLTTKGMSLVRDDVEYRRW